MRYVFKVRKQLVYSGMEKRGVKKFLEEKKVELMDYLIWMYSWKIIKRYFLSLFDY